jgi:hypothetical protein
MNYYYLIASLSDLSLDSEQQTIDFKEIVETIQRNLEPTDETRFKYVLYQNDNRNLLKTLFERNNKLPSKTHTAHHVPAVFSEQEIKDYKKNAGRFPDYMGEFLRHYADQFETMSIAEMEDRLLQLFYEETVQVDPFLAGYYEFETSLKKLFFAYNYSLFDFLKTSAAKDSPAFEQVYQDQSVTNEILRAYPAAEAIGEAIALKKPETIEKLMDSIMWDYLEDVSGFFGIEQLLVYVIRLLMIQRWESLAPEISLKRFNALQESIKNKVHSLQTSLT